MAPAVETNVDVHPPELSVNCTTPKVWLICAAWFVVVVDVCRLTPPVPAMISVMPAAVAIPLGLWDTNRW